MSDGAESLFRAWLAEHPSAAWDETTELKQLEVFVGGFLAGVNYALLQIKEKTTRQSNG